jgi:hypothetical protein
MLPDESEARAATLAKLMDVAGRFSGTTVPAKVEPM